MEKVSVPGGVGSVKAKRSWFGMSMSNISLRKYRLFWLLIAPAFLLRLLTAAYPILQTLYISLTNTDLINRTSAFVGLQNYIRMLSDYGVQGSLAFTTILVVASTALDLMIGMLIALFLNEKFRGRGFARAINLIPWAIPTIVAGYVFRWLLDDQFGLLTTWLYSLTGYQLVAFINDFSARVVVVLVYVWKDAPFIAIIFLAGLQGVPTELYDASKVDGANSWQTFWRITIPLIMPLTVTMGLFRLVWALGSFDLVYGLTQGGPGVATTVLALEVFRTGILFFKFGMASAISVVLLIFVGIIGLVGLWLFRKADTGI